MTDINNEIEKRIHEFLDELNGLVRQAAVQAVADALGGAAQPRPARPAPAPARSATPAPAKAAPKLAAAKPGGGQRKKGEKRPQAELARVRDLLDKHIHENPGRGIEAIGKALAIPTSDLTRPLNKLIAAGRIRKTGDRRATKYFPGGGQPKAPAKPKPAPAAKPPAAPKKAAKMKSAKKK